MKLFATFYWFATGGDAQRPWSDGRGYHAPITVAESHDGSDLTDERLTAPDDVANSINGNADPGSSGRWTRRLSRVRSRRRSEGASRTHR